MDYKNNKEYKRVYPADIYKWLKGSEVFVVTDSHGDSTKMTQKATNEFFIKHTLKNGYLNKRLKKLYVETYNKRYGSITDKYIVMSK